MARDLVGRVAIVGVDLAEVARRLAAEGATVVLVGHDADAAGALLAEIEADVGPGRAAYFRIAAIPAAPGPAASPAAAGDGAPWWGPTGSGSELDALVEFVAEQWPAR